MTIIRNKSENLLGDLSYGDAFSIRHDDNNIYIKTYYADEDYNILCVNIETGQYRYLSTDSEVAPVECCVSVKA